MFKNAFTFLQKIGKALMLPVAVLPVAGLLLGIGAANFEWMPAILSALMKNAGDVIFGNLPLIFAIGVAVGFTENDGVAAISASIGYLVLTTTMGVMANALHVEPATVMGLKTMQTGVFGGILGVGMGIGGGILVNTGVRYLATRYGGQAVNIFFTPWQFFLIIMAIVIMISMITGFYPARRAATIKVLEALRNE